MAKTKSIQEETDEEVLELETSGIRIKLSSTYMLTADSRQYILNKININKETNEETLKPLIYVPTLELVIKWIYQKEIRTRDASTLAELLENANRLNLEIKEMCKAIDGVNLTFKPF